MGVKALRGFGARYCRRGDKANRVRTRVLGSAGAHFGRSMGLEEFDGFVGSRRDRWEGRFNGEEEMGLCVIGLFRAVSS